MRWPRESPYLLRIVNAISRFSPPEIYLEGEFINPRKILTLTEKNGQIPRVENQGECFLEHTYNPKKTSHCPVN